MQRYYKLLIADVAGAVELMKSLRNGICQTNFLTEFLLRPFHHTNNATFLSKACFIERAETVRATMPITFTAATKKRAVKLLALKLNDSAGTRIRMAFGSNNYFTFIT